MSDTIIMVSKDWDNIGSGYDLSPVRHQVITWAICDLLPIEPLGRNVNKIWIDRCI